MLKYVTVFCYLPGVIENIGAVLHTQNGVSSAGLRSSTGFIETVRLKVGENTFRRTLGTRFMFNLRLCSAFTGVAMTDK